MKRAGKLTTNATIIRTPIVKIDSTDVANGASGRMTSIPANARVGVAKAIAIDIFAILQTRHSRRNSGTNP